METWWHVGNKHEDFHKDFGILSTPPPICLRQEEPEGNADARAASVYHCTWCIVAAAGKTGNSNSC